MWVKPWSSKQLSFLQNWLRCWLLKSLAAWSGGWLRFKTDWSSSRKWCLHCILRYKSAQPQSIAKGQTFRTVGKNVLHISQRTHTAVKGRNSWFSFSASLLKSKKPCISKAAAVLIENCRTFLRTNGKLGKCPHPDSQGCSSPGHSGAASPRETTGSNKRWHSRCMDTLHTRDCVQEHRSGLVGSEGTTFCNA